jgi:hypothetical protein
MAPRKSTRIKTYWDARTAGAIILVFLLVGFLFWILPSL